MAKDERATGPASKPKPKPTPTPGSSPTSKRPSKPGPPSTTGPWRVNEPPDRGGPAPASSPPGAGTDARTRFSRDLLTRLKLPVTAENIRFLNAWQQAEGTRAAFNPLATTQPAKGAGNFNTVGVKDYTSYSQGLDATVRTLTNGRYGNILTALRQGNSAERAAQAVAESPWGTGRLVLNVLGSGGGGPGAQPSAPASDSTTAPATSGGASDPLAGTKDPTDAQLREYVDRAASRYGYLAFLLNNPEIRRVLILAVRNGWGDAEVQGELVKTTWWKSTTEAQRRWDVESGQGDQTQAAAINDRHGELRILAARLGVTIPDKELRVLARTSLRNGWDSDDVQSALAARFRYQPGAAPTGQAAVSQTEMRALLSQYALTMTDQALGQWTQQMLSGTRTMDDFRAELIRLAKGSYPGNEAVAKALDAGQTIRQIADPLASEAASLLGIDPAQIDWTAPQWRRFLHSTYDEQAKEYRLMTPDEVRRTVRTDRAYGYAKTARGRSEAAAFGSELRKVLGYAG